GSVRLVVDNEPAVRRALLRLYTSMLRSVAERDLAPFAPLMVVFTCSGMTHILEDIRSDAVRFLDLLADVAPAAVAQHSATILRNFFGLLETQAAGDGSSGTARTALLSQGTRLGIMQSCHNYLAVYTRPALATGDALWFMGADAPLPPPAAEFLYADAAAPFAALGLFGEPSAAPTEAAAVRAQSTEALARLFPFLLATWMEASTVFAANALAADRSLDLCALVLQILQTLWRTAHADAVPPAARDLVGFLRRCMVHFPLGDGYAGSAQAEEALLAMNTRVCELAALVQLGHAGAGEAEAEAEAARWARRAGRYVLQTMGLRARKPKEGGEAPGALLAQDAAANAHLSPDAFAQLLAALWRLALGADRAGAARLLAGATLYARACPLASASKALGIRFVARAVEMHWARVPVRGALDLAPLHGVVADWALALPKLLWQLRDRNAPATAAAASALRLVCQRTRLLDAAAVAALQASLVPLFCVAVPAKGVVFGPFRAYAPAQQRAVLEAIASCPARPARLAAAVRACTVDAAAADARVRVLAAEILGA
ncbi:rRNA processing protein, partial [Kickxella alabastrina]